MVPAGFMCRGIRYHRSRGSIKSPAGPDDVHSETRYAAESGSFPENSKTTTNSVQQQSITALVIVAGVKRFVYFNGDDHTTTRLKICFNSTRAVHDFRKQLK